MKPFKILEQNDTSELKIICVEIYGAGCSVIAHMCNSSFTGVDLISIDTDSESLKQINGIQMIIL